MARTKSVACVLCGKRINANATSISEKIQGFEYAFDKEDCAIMFKKFFSAYGSNFRLMLD